MHKLEPVTSGELVLEEYLMPMEISQYRLVTEIGVPAQDIRDIVAANGPLLPTPTYGYAFWVFRMATGCGHKRPMTRKWQNAR